MAVSTISSHTGIIKLPCFHHIAFSTTLKVFFAANDAKPRRTRRHAVSPCSTIVRQNHRHRFSFCESKSCYARCVLTRASGDGSDAFDAIQTNSGATDSDETTGSLSAFGDSYVALFVRMLGLDHDPLDREQAIVALWKYSLSGKKCVDAIMQFHGCLNLTINLLKSESSATCEAAAGLLRSISSVNSYRESVAESGAVEEITALLSRPSLSPEVKEQSICTLWNLSVDDKLRVKIADAYILRLIIKSLDDEDVKVKEAAGGLLANLMLSRSNHKVMVEAGVIPKLVKLLKGDVEGSKVIKKEAKSALLELAKDEYYSILIIEEGLVPVPIIGAAAYKSFRPGLYSWPSLPDGTEIEQTSKAPSRFGASELLLGLNVDKNVDLEEIKTKAIVGRTQQQFLARIGAIELENKTQSESPTENVQLTLLPWTDGVARLVLILELEDEVAISRAADSVADASINEHMRVLFKEAGAVKPLIQLLDHDCEAVKLSAIRALKKLSVSHEVCQRIEAEGAIHPLVNVLKQSEISETLMEQTLDLIAQILDPRREMKFKFHEIAVNGSEKGLDAARNYDASAEIPSREEVLDSAVIAHLVRIVRTASSNLQRKAISVLEFVSVSDQTVKTLVSEDITSALDAAFQQKILEDIESDLEADETEHSAFELEEAGLTISAASRFLTKLLDSDLFRQTTNSTRFTKLLHKTLKSNIPLDHKNWVAACLVKLSSLSTPNQSFENPINLEVALYETIPRLIKQMSASFSPETKEAAVLELNRIISEGVVDSARAVASQGGIEPLVKLLEQGSERAVDASLAVLYNLSMDSENHAAIIGSGAVQALRRIILAERPQWTRALRLLRNLPV